KPRRPRIAPQPVPITANRKADGTQNESSKVNERKNTAEKPVSHTFRLATHGRACRRAVPARKRSARESKTTPAKASRTKSNSPKRMSGTAKGKSKKSKDRRKKEEGNENTGKRIRDSGKVGFL